MAMDKLNASELDRIFRDSKQIDDSLFAEMRSNLLLVAGEHYQKKGSKFWERIRHDKRISETNKLRLVKNHIKKLTDGIKTSILSHAPGTIVVPINESEVQDQKAAELNLSVLTYYKKELGIRSLTRDFASDFVNIGECCAKVFWDNDLGNLKGYSPIMNDAGEMVIAIDTGQPEVDTIMEGSPVIDRIFGFNLYRDPEVQSMKDSPYLIVVKLVHHRVVRRMTKDQKVLDNLDKTNNDEFLVFDTANNTYTKEKEHVIIREHYYKPCKEYPNGQFYIAVADAVITEGELPFGIWPLAYRGFDKIATSPRARSPIKQMRPYQVEINRCASAIATAQISLGDPKLILRNGGKMTAAGQLPGIRAVHVNGGQDPLIMQGASGENYVPYMVGQIDELYKLMNQFDYQDASKGKLDPYALLYHSMKNKSKFLDPGEEFEDFILEVTEILLATVKEYIDPEMLIPIIGKTEMVNIDEFKNTTPNKYKIKVEAVSSDVDSMLGKQLAINHTLQYVGGSLEKKDIGRMLSAMPFMNYKEAYSDLTIDYDNVKNDILEIERGGYPDINFNDKHDYIIGRIVHRMKQSDFKLLPQDVQLAFADYKKDHEDMQAERIAAIQRAQSGFIPADGYKVKCDFYVTTSEGKTTRAEVPFKALEWLIEQLELQGSPLLTLDDFSKKSLDNVSNKGAATPNQQPREGKPVTNGATNG